jgi:hypothetical protein
MNISQWVAVSGPMFAIHHHETIKSDGKHDEFRLDLHERPPHKGQYSDERLCALRQFLETETDTRSMVLHITAYTYISILVYGTGWWSREIPFPWQKGWPFSEQIRSLRLC